MATYEPFTVERGANVEPSDRRPALVAAAVRVLLVFDAVTFLLGALLHLGVRVPLGFADLDEPRIVPATIVEGLCGIFLAVSAFAVFTRRARAWPAAVAAHAFAVAGVLLGMGALAAGAGPRTPLNDIYHRVILAVLVAGLALLWTRTARAALGHDGRTP